MDHKKKKNDARTSSRNLWIGVGIIGIIIVIFGLWILLEYSFHGGGEDWQITKQAIIATNDHEATFIAATSCGCNSPFEQTKQAIIMAVNANETDSAAYNQTWTAVFYGIAATFDMQTAITATQQANMTSTTQP